MRAHQKHSLILKFCSSQEQLERLSFWRERSEVKNPWRLVGSLGISVVERAYGGILVVEPPKYPHIFPWPRQFSESQIKYPPFGKEGIISTFVSLFQRLPKRKRPTFLGEDGWATTSTRSVDDLDKHWAGVYQPGQDVSMFLRTFEGCQIYL